MSLYKRTAIIIISLLFGLVLILFISARFIMLASFEELEMDDALNHTRHLQSLADREVESLRRMARDMAFQDESYVFVEHYNERFVNEQLGPEALAASQLDFVLFLDRGGKLRYGRAVDPLAGRLRELPPVLEEWEFLRKLAVPRTAANTTHAGWLAVNDRVALIAAMPIHRDQGNGESRGTLVVGRYLETGILSRMESVVNGKVRAFSLAAELASPALGQVVRELEGGLNAVTRSDEEHIAAYVLLPDIFDRPQLLVEVRLPRDLFAQGRSALSYYVLSLLLSGLVFGLVFLVLLDKLVLSRLDRLSNRVAAIGSSKDFSARIENHHADELGRLSSAINAMLDELEQAQKKLATARDDLEVRVEERTQELRRTQQQVVEQERMRALGRMASGIAHDFNNALATILGACELLLMMKQDDLPNDNGRDREFIESIHTAARDAANAVSRLREFYRAREENEVLHRVDVGRLVQQVVSMTEPMWKNQAQAHGISLAVRAVLPDEPIILMANEAELREMLTNLIFNSVDALPEGGAITLDVAQRGDEVVLSVADTGIGMTADVRERCLEPFYTTKGENGTGLGLAMVHGIVRRHEGSLEIDSCEAKGTTVRLRFPLNRSEVSIEEEEAEVASVTPIRVLLVDDVDSVRRLIKAYLVMDGHAVVEANNGLTGLQAFREGGFDLVITDRGMPEMSGDQLAAEISTAMPSLPIVMLTGFGEMMRSAGEQPPGVDLIVSKPVTITTLRRAIRQVLEQARSEAHLLN